jgi:hypothetical protein
MLWAWERPENFPPLPPGVGVAYLAGSLFLVDSDVETRTRMQPLVVAPGTPLVAVVRIEFDAARPADLSRAQAERAARALLALGRRPAVGGLQVDFDATVAQRPFYTQLLADLRRAMPADWPLSITALASWCLGDPWIRTLPIDEAVPMLFQMGPDGRPIRERLAAGQDFSLPVCRESVGVSLQEPLTGLWPARRRYVFTTGRWNQVAVAQASRR